MSFTVIVVLKSPAFPFIKNNVKGAGQTHLHSSKVSRRGSSHSLRRWVMFDQDISVWPDVPIMKTSSLSIWGDSLCLLLWFAAQWWKCRQTVPCLRSRQGCTSETSSWGLSTVSSSLYFPHVLPVECLYCKVMAVQCMKWWCFHSEALKPVDIISQQGDGGMDAFSTVF